MLTQSPYIASYLMVDRKELDFFLSQSWPLFNFSLNGDNSVATFQGKCTTVLRDFNCAASTTNAKLMSVETQHQRQEENDVGIQVSYEFNYFIIETKHPSCRCDLLLSEKEKKEKNKNAHGVQRADNLSSPLYNLPTVFLLTAALLNGGLITRIAINELDLKNPLHSTYDIHTEESQIYEKIRHISSKNPLIESYVSNITNSILQLLDSLKSSGLIDFTGIEIDARLIDLVEKYLSMKSNN